MMAKQDRPVSALAELLRVLGNRTRLEIVMLLLGGKRNVSYLCEALRRPQPAMSHHLRTLRAGGQVRAQREGREGFYCVRDFRRDRRAGALKAMVAGSRVVRIGPLVLGIAAD